MILTNKQEEALRICVDRYRNYEPYTIISGYAGSGKTTVVQHIISALELEPSEDVAYIAYTGKASEVLRERGCPNAQTAHKLLYYSKQMPNGKFSYRPRSSIGPYKLIIVDEVSMLPLDLWELLISHGKYVIALGDPFQLPPVSKDQDNHLLEHPHVFLDEVMRQAKESDIITTSMMIREGCKLNPLKGNDINIFARGELCTGMYTWADEILTATNKTRQDINDYMRQTENRSSEPEKGDKVICLRNSWDTISNKENPLINGTIGHIQDYHVTNITYHTPTMQKFTIPVMYTDIVSTSGDLFKSVPIDYQSLTTGKKFLDPKDEYQICRCKDNVDLPIEFNYGYAITAHRAQGSQWDKILVVEERFPFDREEHARWLYTSLTRGISRVTLILK